MTDESGYISGNGSEIYYEVSGNRDGEPLLMLHGGLGSMAELKALQEYVSGEYRLISMDFRGHGRSLLGDHRLSYWQYQQDAQQLLSHLGVDKYSIFGFSDGGIVGYRLAALEPGRVSCLVTLGSQWRLQDGDPSIELLGGLTADKWAARFADDVAVYEVSNPKPDFPKLVDAVKAVWLDTSEFGYPAGLVAKIRCPTLVMRGDQDFLFPLDSAVALRSKIKDCSFANIPMTAHACHHESPEFVGKILSQFMSQVHSPSGG